MSIYSCDMATGIGKAWNNINTVVVVVVVVVVYLFRQEQTIHYTHNTKRTITEAGHQKGR